MPWQACIGQRKTTQDLFSPSIFACVFGEQTQITKFVQQGLLMTEHLHSATKVLLFRNCFDVAQSCSYHK